MKETYETPKCEIIEFETEDVIRSSVIGDGGGDFRSIFRDDLS